MNMKIRIIGAILVLAVWAGLAGFAWFGAPQEFSEAERRPLEQMPEISSEQIFGGKFMTEFESYTLDQFPLRDRFRQIKSLFHYYVMQQGDNNGIYIANGYAAKMEYPLHMPSVNHAVDRFRNIYDKYLKAAGSNVYMAVVPDKGYYLASSNGYLSMDYGTLFQTIREGMPWATHIDLTDCLTGTDYYYTDTHWRQEKLIPAAQKLCAAMGVTIPNAEEFTIEQLERPFYGVYYGQAALPMDPEVMYLLQSPVINSCRVYDHETGKTSQVYNREKLTSKDLYDVYLSGARALLTIENPRATTDRKLIVFRDSFGSSMIPLLLQDYKTVTVVDIRYIASDFLGQFIDFHGQDVLFLYSTLVINSSSVLK